MSLVAWYKLDELSGVIRDSAGNTSGTVTGAIPTDGKINGAYYFNGVVNYDKIQFQSSIPPTQGSMCLWIKGLIGAGNQRAQNIYPIGWQNRLSILGPQNGTTERSGIITHKTTDLYYNWGNKNIYDNNWHHYVVTWDSTYVYLYLDGKMIDSPKKHAGEFGGITAANFDIGCGWTSSYGPHTGIIDDVRLYDHALTLDEVAWIYNEGNGQESAMRKGIFLGIKSNGGSHRLRKAIAPSP